MWMGVAGRVGLELSFGGEGRGWKGHPKVALETGEC